MYVAASRGAGGAGGGCGPDSTSWRSPAASPPRRPLTDGAVAPPDDGFFDPSARFVGAFRDVDDTWDAGWAVWQDLDL